MIARPLLDSRLEVDGFRLDLSLPRDRGARDQCPAAVAHGDVQTQLRSRRLSRTDPDLPNDINSFPARLALSDPGIGVYWPMLATTDRDDRRL